MKQTLEQAAKDYAEINDNSSITNGFSIVKFAAFKAGAEWMKKRMCKDCPNRGNSPKIPLSEFEKNLERKIKCYTGIVQTKTAAKQWAKELMSLAKKQMCKDCPNRGNTHAYLQGLENGKQQFCERNYIKGFNAAIERIEVELQAMRKKYKEEDL